MYPDAFQFGPFSVNWYGFMVALGFLAGLWTASRRGLRAGWNPETVLDIGPWLILGAVIGARLLYVITFWREQFAGEPWLEVLKVWKGGLVYYGGLIGASLACILFARVKRFELWKLADLLAPSIPLGYVFGRVGCFLNGCCYGAPCKLPWAVHYPAPHETHAAEVGVHPTQIYDAILSLGLYAGLAWFFPRRRFPGQVFAAYLIGYACLRGFVEIFRGDYPAHQRFLSGWVTPAQAVSLVILGAGLSLWWILRRRAQPQ